MPRTAIAIHAAALLMAAGTATGLSPADKCESAKLREAGRYGVCRLKAVARAVKIGGLPDYATCDGRLASRWPAVESAGGGMCPSNGDEMAIQAFIARHTADVAMALAGGTLPDCPGAQACGNGVIDAGEDCDFGSLNGATCGTEGFLGGVLACGDGCAFDASGCWNGRFADNADGTITDRQSGLMWEKKTERDGGAAFYANPHDADNYHAWSGFCTGNTSKLCQPSAAAAAACLAGAEGGTTGCDECAGGEGICHQSTTIWTHVVDLNAAAFAGYGNWRVPSRAEIDTILDLGDPTPPLIDAAFDGVGCGPACTDLTDPACSCTPPGIYWSATASAPAPGDAWFAFFGSGEWLAYGRTNFGYVRAVRNGM